jgi:hypothetical protein
LSIGPSPSPFHASKHVSCLSEAVGIPYYTCAGLKVRLAQVHYHRVMPRIHTCAYLHSVLYCTVLYYTLTVLHSKGKCFSILRITPPFYPIANISDFFWPHPGSRPSGTCCIGCGCCGPPISLMWVTVRHRYLHSPSPTTLWPHAGSGFAFGCGHFMRDSPSGLHGINIYIYEKVRIKCPCDLYTHSIGTRRNGGATLSAGTLHT